MPRTNITRRRNVTGEVRKLAACFRRKNVTCIRIALKSINKSRHSKYVVTAISCNRCKYVSFDACSLYAAFLLIN